MQQSDVAMKITYKTSNVTDLHELKIEFPLLRYNV